MKASRVWFVVAVIYLVGITGFIIPSMVPLFEWLIPVNILFAFAVLLFGEEKISVRHLQLFTVCFLFGFCASRVAMAMLWECGQPAPDG